MSPQNKRLNFLIFFKILPVIFEKLVIMIVNGWEIYLALFKFKKSSPIIYKLFSLTFWTVYEIRFFVVTLLLKTFLHSVFSITSFTFIHSTHLGLSFFTFYERGVKSEDHESNVKWFLLFFSFFTFFYSLRTFYDSPCLCLTYFSTYFSILLGKDETIVVSSFFYLFFVKSTLSLLNPLSTIRGIS